MASLLAFLILGVPVSGEARCPTPDAVGQALDALGTVPSDTATSAHVSEIGGERLLVELLDARGKPLASREFDVLPDCHQMAKTAAVVLALWLTQLGEQLIVPLPLPTPVPAPTAKSSSRWRWRMSAAGGASIDAAGPAAEGTASAALVFASLPIALGGELALFGATLRGRSLPTGGSTGYSRFGLGLSGLVRWPLGSVSLEGRLGVLGAILDARGSGLETNLTATLVELGLTLRLRLTLEKALRPVRPFVEVGGNVWPRPEQAYLGLAPTGTYFPQWEALVLAGLAFDLL